MGVNNFFDGAAACLEVAAKPVFALVFLRGAVASASSAAVGTLSSETTAVLEAVVVLAFGLVILRERLRIGSSSLVSFAARAVSR